jgi:hypothetical protein
MSQQAVCNKGRLYNTLVTIHAMYICLIRIDKYREFNKTVTSRVTASLARLAYTATGYIWPKLELKLAQPGHITHNDEGGLHSHTLPTLFF